jgi:hypothetical protein
MRRFEVLQNGCVPNFSRERLRLGIVQLAMMRLVFLFMLLLLDSFQGSMQSFVLLHKLSDLGSQRLDLFSSCHEDGKSRFLNQGDLGVGSERVFWIAAVAATIKGFSGFKVSKSQFAIKRSGLG